MIWLPDMDLNHGKQTQSLLCSRYTIGQTGARDNLMGAHLESSRQPPALRRGARLSFCTLADSLSLTPCFSWGQDDALTRQPFQRLSPVGKPLKAVARLRPPSPTQLKQGVNERAVDSAVPQRCPPVHKLNCSTRRL